MEQGALVRKYPVSIHRLYPAFFKQELQLTSAR